MYVHERSTHVKNVRNSVASISSCSSNGTWSCQVVHIQWNQVQEKKMRKKMSVVGIRIERDIKKKCEEIKKQSVVGFPRVHGRECECKKKSSTQFCRR
jgi:hypothetical protein